MYGFDLLIAFIKLHYRDFNEFLRAVHVRSRQNMDESRLRHE